MKKYFLLAIILIGVCLNVGAQDVEVFPQLGHAISISSLAFSPDGRKIITGSFDNTIKLWDVATKREIRTLNTSSYVASLAISPDGRIIISGSGDTGGIGDRYGIIIMWDASTGRKIRTIEGHTLTVNSIAYSTDGRLIASSSINEIKIWNAVTGIEIRTINTENVYTIAFSPDGKTLISGAKEGLILWDVSTGREKNTLYAGYVASVVYSPDGRNILFGTDNNTVELYDAISGNKIVSWRHSSRFSELYPDSKYSVHVAFSPDGRKIVSRSTDLTIKIWDIVTRQELKTLTLEAGGSNEPVSFSPDGSLIVYGTVDSNGDKIIFLYNFETGEQTYIVSYVNRAQSVKYAPDSNQIVTASDKTIKLWDVIIGREIRTFSGYSHGWESAVKFSSDSRQILFSSNDGTIKLWDTITGREISTFKVNSGTEGTVNVVFSPDESQILSSNGSNIKLWDMVSGREIRTFSGHSDYVTSVAFSPDGRQIVSASWDNTIKLWDTETGREILDWTSSTQRWGVTTVAFSPDGRQIILGDLVGRLELLDANTGQKIKTFFGGHNERITTLVFSPDCSQILSSDGRQIKLWNINTGREIRTFSGHFGRVMSICFSPDEQYILSCSQDGTVRLWDTSTGKEIAQFISFIDGEWIVVTPDGYYNASPNGDRYLNVRFGNNVYGIDQYRNTFYNPQIVEARLQGKPDPARGQGTLQQAGEPPTVVIRSPVNGARLTTSQTELSVVINSKLPIRNIQFLVNGRLISGDAVRGMRGIRGVELEGTGVKITGNQNRLDFTVNLQLDPGNNRIEVIAKNPHEGRDSVEVFNQQAAASNTPPNLWILSIGVNRYDSPLLDNLRYAVNDAREIVNIFKAQEGKIYGKVNSRLIADGEAILPTRDNITDNLSYLRQAAPDDVVLLFIAGHGLNDEVGNFYFMPSDASFTDNGAIRTSRAISHREIQGVLDVPGQKLVFIDACHSNNASSNRNIRTVDNNRLVRDLQVQSQSTVIFTSSRGNQPSHEMDNLRHGVFTHSIIQGMRGAANPDENGIISMLSLSAYVSKRVNEITSNSQTPTISIPEGFSDFRVARSR